MRTLSPLSSCRHLLSRVVKVKTLLLSPLHNSQQGVPSQTVDKTLCCASTGRSKVNHVTVSLELEGEARNGTRRRPVIVGGVRETNRKRKSFIFHSVGKGGGDIKYYRNFLPASKNKEEWSLHQLLYSHDSCILLFGSLFSTWDLMKTYCESFVSLLCSPLSAGFPFSVCVCDSTVWPSTFGQINCHTSGAKASRLSCGYVPSHTWRAQPENYAMFSLAAVLSYQYAYFTLINLRNIQVLQC